MPKFKAGDEVYVDDSEQIWTVSKVKKQRKNAKYQAYSCRRGNHVPYHFLEEQLRFVKPPAELVEVPGERRLTRQEFAALVNGAMVVSVACPGCNVLKLEVRPPSGYRYIFEIESISDNGTQSMIFRKMS